MKNTLLGNKKQERSDDENSVSNWFIWINII